MYLTNSGFICFCILQKVKVKSGECYCRGLQCGERSATGREKQRRQQQQQKQQPVSFGHPTRLGLEVGEISVLLLICDEMPFFKVGWQNVGWLK